MGRLILFAAGVIFGGILFWVIETSSTGGASRRLAASVPIPDWEAPTIADSAWVLAVGKEKGKLTYGLYQAGKTGAAELDDILSLLKDERKRIGQIPLRIWVTVESPVSGRELGSIIDDLERETEAWVYVVPNDLR
jgi:hypothetical protein